MLSRIKEKHPAVPMVPTSLESYIAPKAAAQSSIIDIFFPLIILNILDICR